MLYWAFLVLAAAGLAVLGWFAFRLFLELRRLARRVESQSARLAAAAGGLRQVNGVLGERVEQTSDRLPARRA